MKKINRLYHDGPEGTTVTVDTPPASEPQPAGDTNLTVNTGSDSSQESKE